MSFLRESLVLCLLLALALGEHDEWEKFKQKHGKKFKHADHEVIGLTLDEDGDYCQAN
jgi:hypothetical protein